uniref:SET domain-containing protein n=1 Tax=Panagrolaimus davidi TaxID=227884 RepID=A0A914Q7I5_9BILA
MACLKIGAFYMAFKAAEIGLEKGGNREKALFRMGQAKYGMREWQKAADYFLEVLNEFPDNISSSTQIKRVSDRLAELNHGSFDFKKLCVETEESDLDIADYKGPIEIADIPGKGRGIIATKDIKEGTLLVVSKPFASGYKKDLPEEFIPFLPNDLPQRIAQFTETIKNLQNNPEQANEVYKLYAGDNVAKYEDIPFGVIDAQRIQQICFHNPFGIVDESADAHSFILPSYFNHSCLANAVQSFYGGVIVIHASEDIKKGDEIFITYINPLNGYLERKTEIMARNFVCLCKLCKLDANDPNCLMRNQIMKELESYGKENSAKDVIAKGEPILKKIRESYVNRNELKVVLAQTLMILASAYFKAKETAKAMKYVEEIISLMDNPLKYELGIVDIRINMGIKYFIKNDFSKYKEMIKKAMELSFCNNDMEFFKALYPEYKEYLKYY